MHDRIRRSARRIVVPFGLLGGDEDKAVDVVERALRREAGRADRQLVEMAGHPRQLFEAIAASPALQALVLAGARETRPTRSRGVHLGGDPLFSQWALAERDGWVLRIHCFHRDDPDVPHNHSWAWETLILAGGYFDVGADGTRAWRAPGDRVVDDGSRFHRVELLDGSWAWTLFLHGPEVRSWGFLGADGAIIPRDEFVSVRATV